MNKHVISLPEEAQAYVDARMTAGQFPNVNAYVVDLVEKDRLRREAAYAELKQMMDEAEASGISGKSIDEIFDELDREFFGAAAAE